RTFRASRGTRQPSIFLRAGTRRVLLTAGGAQQSRQHYGVITSQPASVSRVLLFRSDYLAGSRLTRGRVTGAAATRKIGAIFGARGEPSDVKYSGRPNGGFPRGEQMSAPPLLTC